MLVQNHGRQAAIVARIAQARGRFGSLARAKSDGSWRGFAGGIAQIVKEMPLWKLQVARWAYGQAEATSAQLWVSLKYTVNADGRCLEILGA